MESKEVSTDDQNAVIVSRKDRVQICGIECVGPFGDGILFKGGEWSPGGEYVQRLRVKNVSNKLKKLKYRLPTTKYFSLSYPEVIVLSPGTTQELDVVFRPIESEVYNDVIFFKMLDGPNAGGFNVPVRALLPTLQVSIPSGMDLGYCQADDTSSRVFYVKNTGEVPAPFAWEVPQPFSISPSTGVAAVGESIPITCSLKPADASVFVGVAVIKVGEGVNAIKPAPLLEMKVSAIGKYCHVAASEDKLDFGKVVVGCTGDSVRKEFSLTNHSVVPASFKIVRVDRDRDSTFTLHPSKAVIPPEDEVVVSAVFDASAAGTFSAEQYEVVTIGGNKVRLTLQGWAVGPRVTLEKKEDPFAQGQGVSDSVNFRDVQVGHMTTRVVYLYNQSEVPARFCFAVEGESSIFKFSQTRGVIPSCGTDNPGEVQITITFTPEAPSNYYRRIFCLIENQHPLPMDLLGTGYINAKGEVKEQRPAPLRHAHVQAFKNRSNADLGRCSPEQLDKILATQGMSDLFASIGPQGTLPLKRATVARPLTRSGEATRVQTAAASEFFIDHTDLSQNEIVVDQSVVDFGYVGGSAQKTVNITNTTNTKVHVLWNLGPSEEDFGVSPKEMDIPPRSSMPFRVVLSPSQGNCYFFRELEAFIFPKNQRTFRLVKDATLQPPWCLCFRAAGHTFTGEQYLAKAAMSTNHAGQRLTFPACHFGDTVYQTIRLTNLGNIPVYFSFQPDPFGVFYVKPEVGLIPAGDFQV
ncbi:unnamed protein product, partial [Discosporangium mesarthrocarpum]